MANNEKSFFEQLKKAVAIFRGSSTGCGTTYATNMRIKAASLSQKFSNILDAGITKWKARPRKQMGQKYLQTIDKNLISSSYPQTYLPLKSNMSPEDQSKYKYILNIDGHVSAFRLSLELSMGSVILLVDSDYNLWFKKYLVAWTHYVPIKADLSDLISQIRWCQKNDS